jgi:hypothetical protein
MAWAFLTVKVLREPRNAVNSASRMTSFRRGFVMTFLLFATCRCTGGKPGDLELPVLVVPIMKVPSIAKGEPGH